MNVSVVVPAFNEEALLAACLDSLLAQDYAGEIEIIVVDNASTDATAEIALARGVRVVSEPERGYSRALASGFAAASGEVIATTDADTVVPPDWISRLVREYHEHPDAVAVGGEIVFCRPNRRARLFTHALLPLVNLVDRRCPEGPHLWGANFSVRRCAFLAAGGWNLDFNLQVDTELSERLRAHGRVVLLEDLRVFTSCRRWNRVLGRSLFLYATNFLSLQLRGRPLWRGFPDVRDRPAPAARARLAPLAWGIAALVATLVGTAVYDAVSPWSSAFGSTHWAGPHRDRVVALTFDDGPNEPYTSQILGILSREHVRATFFLIGQRVRQDPAVAARIVRDGNAVGNHSDTHPFALALEPVARIRAEIAGAEIAIHDATGIYPRLFRPPQGLRSPWLMQVAESDSLVTVTWDDSAVDWRRLTERQLVDRVVAGAHPGAIILLHDGLDLTEADRSTVVAGLPVILRRLRSEGYRFVTVPELLHESPRLAKWR
ncbi:MAG TPA: glycosyltransferase [Candidatus Limnocylindrales bacterium]|nr:glycosyltransferase [Candidatus Limnocylindrales bacterium]